MTKSESRKTYLSLRAQFTNEEIECFSNQITNQLFSNFDFSDKIISVFLPIVGKNEMNTNLFIKRLANLKSTVGIPKADFNTFELTHFRYDSESQLEISNYGIPEPISGEVLPANTFNFVIVPLIIFDKKGYRTGYGKGFYDRFLSYCSTETIFIGVSFFEPIEILSDVHSNDIPLHYCVTPNSIYKF